MNFDDKLNTIKSYDAASYKKFNPSLSTIKESIKNVKARRNSKQIDDNTEVIDNVTKKDTIKSALKFNKAKDCIIEAAIKNLNLKTAEALGTKNVEQYFKDLLSICTSKNSEPIKLSKEDKNIIYILTEQKLNITNVCSNGEMSEKIKQQSHEEDKYTFEAIDLVQIIQSLNQLANAQSSTNSTLTLGIQQAMQANNLTLNSLNTVQNLSSDLTKYIFQNLR